MSRQSELAELSRVYDSSALSNRNLIINGDMQVNQRLGLESNTRNGYGSVDRFSVLYTGNDEAPTQEQTDVASGTTPYTLGFRKAFKVTNGNQTSGAGAADYVGIYYYMEGQDISSSGWNATNPDSKITLSYWVKSSVAQTFYGKARAYASSQYEHTYSIPLSANTWTKVTETMSGNSNFSSLVNTNAAGFNHSIMLFFGTDYTNNKTLGEWAVKDNANKSPDMASTWYTTNDATFEITGVQLEVGDTATPFEHRSYADQLQRCERYYQVLLKHGDASDGGNTVLGAAGVMYSSSYLAAPFSFKTTMRASPTLRSANSTGCFKFYRNGSNDVFDDFSTGTARSTYSLELYNNTDISGTAGHAGFIYAVNSNATLAVDAEL
jgi:hypothetical protein